MTDRIKEQLSTFLDGELPDQETALLLKRLERDDELRGALSRYSLIGAVLRSEGNVPAARQVAARVSAAIAKEPARATGFMRDGRDSRVRTMMGLAVAAGVAAGAVLVMQQFATQDPARPELIAQVEAPVEPVAELVEPQADEPSASYVTPPAAQAPGGIAPAELANYLVAHYGYASPLMRRSVGAGLMTAPDSVAATEASAMGTQDSQ